MTRFLIIAETLLAVACVLLAWRWVVVLDPASPLVPFVLCIMGGGLIVDAWQRLGDALDTVGQE